MDKNIRFKNSSKLNLQIFLQIVYNTFMAKRATGVGSKKQGTPYKTKKRLEAKRAMLEEKAAKGMRHTRKIASLKSA